MLSNSIFFILINITINKNKIAIAPTYIINKKSPIKSPFNKINKIELKKNINIKKKTELTGFFDNNIKKEHNIKKKHNKNIIIE